MSGVTVTALEEGQKQIPVVARLRMDERGATLRYRKIFTCTDRRTVRKIPLVQVSKLSHELVTGRIIRLEQFRTINVRTFPTSGPFEF